MSLSITTTVPDAPTRYGYGFIETGEPAIFFDTSTTSAWRSSSARCRGSRPTSSTTSLPSFPMTRSELRSITVPRKNSASETV